MIDVKLLRIVTGEEVIAELIEENASSITVQNGLVVLPTNNGVGFAPWATVIDPEHPEIALDMKHVIYSVEVAPDVIKQYVKLFGGPDIITPSKQLIL